MSVTAAQGSTIGYDNDDRQALWNSSVSLWIGKLSGYVSCREEDDHFRLHDLPSIFIRCSLQPHFEPSSRSIYHTVRGGLWQGRRPQPDWSPVKADRRREPGSNNSWASA
ncbi:hypothetical protein HRR83_002827 [Exophiala dermatitidis]|uniref:Uncharacterized protein n=1 Tax=Exophiala dermatitidis TaxID=5970 RepID=A0AAN6IW43_EXODE|nr:hypothetical protein HRR74_003741 [Exophiala dermatitidis]KAJ4521882.1 hypothetical protein HRR73_003081 [Exophiala dermatitidis]KAJ4537613.1 hypothetical protein HRR76_005604 [Exophiala dermatitidis]KAJ4551723.1 hypothetical protein HRR77_002954 [Exophiala dermatitidis]KAJ4569457.1 hypothetical protein HRR79_004308 [Exophiala dermatitidis]